MKRVLSALCTLAVAAAFGAGAVRADDEPVTAMNGKILIIKEGKLAKFISKPVSPATFALPGAGNDPTVEGATLTFREAGGPEIAANLPSSGWKGLGNPAGSKGYKYKGTGQAADPCKVVLVKEKVVKAVCKKAGVTLQPPFSGDEGIVLGLGAALTDRYCALFGGSTVRNVSTIFKRKLAPEPGACPTPSGGTTTTSSTTISSTTSTSLGGLCCNGDSFLNFTSDDSSGDCGDIIDSGGMLVTNVECAGLYTGGGGNSVPLPYALPDQSSAVSAIASCAGDVATLGPATSGQTGTDKNCTEAGCFFGAPLPVPNPVSTPTSVCVMNTLSADISGTVNCATGATDIDAPLSSVLFLTGDTSNDPSSTIAGIQPCPLCSAGACVGGSNDMGACTPGTSALNPSFPTSIDCPPDPMANIGTLPVVFSLTSGALTWSGTPATNDTGSTVSVQSRVFSGFCRDADGTLAFEGSTPATAKLCWENGAAVGTPCAGTFESCEQRNNGAFGPSGGANRTIVAIGNGMSIIGGPAAGTLVSIFSIRPTFNATVDAAGDLPGPGVVALPGTAQTCATANPCP